MVRAARAWRNIYVVNVDGRVVDYGGNGLKFEEVITRDVDRQGGVLHGVVYEKS